MYKPRGRSPGAVWGSRDPGFFQLFVWRGLPGPRWCYHSSHHIQPRSRHEGGERASEKGSKGSSLVTVRNGSGSYSMMTLSLFTRHWPGLSHILSCKGVGECGFTLCSHVPSEEFGALSPQKKGEHELLGSTSGLSPRLLRSGLVPG